MSYYATISIGGEVKKESVDEFKNAIEEIKAKREKIIEKDKSDTELEFVDYFFNDSPFKIIFLNDTFWLQTDDSYTQHFGNDYFDDEFVKFIAPYLEPQDIGFWGENTEYWGYRIKKSYKLVRLGQEFVEGVEL